MSALFFLPDGDTLAIGTKESPGPMVSPSTVGQDSGASCDGSSASSSASRRTADHDDDHHQHQHASTPHPTSSSPSAATPLPIFSSLSGLCLLEGCEDLLAFTQTASSSPPPPPPPPLLSASSSLLPQLAPIQSQESHAPSQQRATPSPSSERPTLARLLSLPAAASARPCTIGWLPPELLIRIFTMLDVVSLFSCGQVCRLWRELVRDGDIYRSVNLSKGLGSLFLLHPVGRSLYWRQSLPASSAPLQSDSKAQAHSGAGAGAAIHTDTAPAKSDSSSSPEEPPMEILLPTNKLRTSFSRQHHPQHASAGGAPSSVGAEELPENDRGATSLALASLVSSSPAPQQSTRPDVDLMAALSRWVARKHLLLSGANLRHLNLSNCEALVPEHVLCATLTSATSLLTLNLSGCNVSNRVLECVPRTLRELDVSYCTHVTDAGVGVIAARCTNLQVFRCKHVSDLTDFSLSMLASYRHHLRELDLEGCVNMTSVGLWSVLAAGGGELRMITLRACDSMDGAVCRALAQHCPLLEKIDFSYLPLKDYDITVLAASCTRLSHVRLWRCSSLTDMAVTDLANFCPFLQELDLMHCVGLVNPKFDRFARLSKLAIQGCRNISRSTLAATLAMSSLESLNCSHTAIDDETVELAALLVEQQSATSASLRGSAEQQTDSAGKQPFAGRPAILGEFEASPAFHRQHQDEHQLSPTALAKAQNFALQASHSVSLSLAFYSTSLAARQFPPKTPPPTHTTAASALMHKLRLEEAAGSAKAQQRGHAAHRLASLDASNSKLGDRGIGALSLFAHRLSYIALSFTDTTDASVLKLPTAFPRLCTLYVRGCHGVTDESISRLTTQLGNLQQVHLTGTKVSQKGKDLLRDNNIVTE